MAPRATQRSAGRATALLGAAIMLTVALTACGSDGNPIRIVKGSAWQLVQAPRLMRATPRPEPSPAATPPPADSAIYPGYPISQRSGTIPPTYPPSGWNAMNVNPSSKRVTIVWDVPMCTTEVHRTVVYVAEHPTNVVIDVWQDATNHVLGKDEGCTTELRETDFTVKLAAPIGERELLEHQQPSTEPEPTASVMQPH